MISSALPSAAIAGNTANVFDTSWESIVIVPPEPDSSLSSSAELTYSHLYDYANYDQSAYESAPTATTVTSGSESSFDSHAFSDVAGNQKSDSALASASSGITRDPNKGAFTFQVNAEYDLLLHVQRELDRNNVGALSDVESAKVILRSIDEYCLRKQWMYHIGSDKGVHLSKFLKKATESFLKRTNNSNRPRFVAADLGTYCGYSAILIAMTLRECLPPGVQFHVYTTETSSKHLQVAQSMFRLAKMDKFITTILVDQPNETTAQALAKYEEGGVDFALFDHAKEMYLGDLKGMERTGVVRKGTCVAADNVVFNRLDSYRSHVHELASLKVAETILVEMPLEYSNNLKDGIELTMYLKDPK